MYKTKILNTINTKKIYLYDYSEFKNPKINNQINIKKSCPCYIILKIKYINKNYNDKKFF